MSYSRLWIGFAAVVGFSFLVLGYFGYEVYMQAPPVPDQIRTEDGKVVFTADDIKEGQSVWQSIGGQEVGSVWGHGAYVAPDWSADFLHRELVFILDRWAQKDFGIEFSKLEPEKQAALKERLKNLIRTNRFDQQTRSITISADESSAIEEVGKHYSALFTGDPNMSKLRDAYALQPQAIKDPVKMKQLVGFFYWTAWACSTNRPGSDVTYTNNWPAESLIGNAPAAAIIVWSVLSFVFLLAGIGALAWYFAAERGREAEHSHEIPDHDPLLALTPTPSMQATQKYFWAAGALLVVQVGLGAVTAHYGVEGSGFYGIPLSQWLPYAVTRTWHTQLGILWIATTWLATGLFIAPAVSGYEPKF